VQKSRGPTTTLGDARFLWAHMTMVTQIGSGMVAGTGERKMARPARGKLQQSHVPWRLAGHQVCVTNVTQGSECEASACAQCCVQEATLGLERTCSRRERSAVFGRVSDLRWSKCGCSLLASLLARVPDGAGTTSGQWLQDTDSHTVSLIPKQSDTMTKLQQPKCHDGVRGGSERCYGGGRRGHV
jgi:hypothetical protein